MQAQILPTHIISSKREEKTSMHTPTTRRSKRTHSGHSDALRVLRKAKHEDLAAKVEALRERIKEEPELDPKELWASALDFYER